MSVGTEIVDGDTFCDGVCDETHTIIVAVGDGSARDELIFQDLTGVIGDCIDIVNEDSALNLPVLFNSTSEDGYCVVRFHGCQYVDFHGDNDSGITPSDNGIIHGFKIVADGEPEQIGKAVVISGVCDGKLTDTLTISYLEIDGDRDNNDKSSGIGIQMNALDICTAEDRYNNIEIHHCYIHDMVTKAFYLGENQGYWDNEALGFDQPFIDGILVHDNLIEDTGTGGGGIKGIRDKANGDPAGRAAYYNNIVRRTGLNPTQANREETYVGYWGSGAGVAYIRDGNTFECYNNIFEDTAGQGFGVKAGYGFDPGQVHIHDNIFINTNLIADYGDYGPPTGGGTEGDYHEDVAGGAIFLAQGARYVLIEDNIMVNCNDYAVLATDDGFSGWKVTDCTMKRNIICGVGVGEWLNEGGCTGLSEGTGADANITQSDCANQHFQAYSDDDDHTNDFYRLYDLYPTNNMSGFPPGNNLTFTRTAGVDNVDIWFGDHSNLTASDIVADDTTDEFYNPPADLTAGATYYWNVLANHPAGDETLQEDGSEYKFIVTGDTPAEPTYTRGPGIHLIYSPHAGSLIYKN